MASMTGQYLGGLRTQDTHLLSGNQILTDAPPDNQGKGEAFSPTDLVSAALSSCMMTMMGIVARRDGVSIDGMSSRITKIMTSNPRRIAEIQIEFSLPGLAATPEQIQKLKNAALTCPVALSLADSLKQTVSFDF